MIEKMLFSSNKVYIIGKCSHGVLLSYVNSTILYIISSAVFKGMEKNDSNAKVQRCTRHKRLLMPLHFCIDHLHLLAARFLNEYVRQKIRNVSRKATPMNTFVRFRPAIFGLAFIIALTLTLFSQSQLAYARLAVCRSDPLVVLSDGTVLDISADIGALLWDVEEVHYDLHIPKGLSVVVSVSTPNWPTTVERFRVYADNPPGTFTSTTTVFTREENTPVTANFLVNTIYRTLDGVSGQPLTVEIKPRWLLSSLFR
jgi:hypothetical protein